MKKKRLLSIVLTVSMMFGISNTFIVNAKTLRVFKNPLPVIEKQAYRNEKFTAKPLVILMDFPDYKYTDLDEKEKDFRINAFTGKESTAEFYENLFFGEGFYKTSDGKEHITVNKFLKEESGGTYEFKGKVYGWYTADNPAAYYGKTQKDAAKLVKEAIQKVVSSNKDLDLSQFDVEDKWDIDHDGNYNEPDGIIDTVVVIHAGLGEEWGGGSLKEDAIWPFRIGFSWYNNEVDLNKEGEKLKQKNEKGEYPAYNFKDGKGKEWFAEDFTVFEQDLPVDLFGHEYGHVLGLPDLYGTDSESQPPVESWSLMGGSYTGDPRGSQPVSYGAYCKQLLQKDFENRKRIANWQKSKVINLASIDEKGLDVVLDESNLKGKNNDCVRIDLPKRESRDVVPFQGEKFYFSGKGDNLENWMKSKKVLDLSGKNSIKLTFNTWYKIDEGFDFASIMVKEEGSNKWTAVKGNITTTEVDKWVKDNEKPEEWLIRNPGHAITGTSAKVKGADVNGWIAAEFDLNEFKGKKIELGFRFKADGNTPEKGIYIDSLKVSADGKEIFTDNGEGIAAFNLEGFSLIDGREYNNQYYLLEWRNGENGLVDQGLNVVNIGRPGLKYNKGLVVWYINEKYLKNKDQNVKEHPGELFVGVVDANQNPVKMKNGDEPEIIATSNYQMHDASFSLRKVNKLDIKWKNSKWIAYDTKSEINPVFEDSTNYTAAGYNSTNGLILNKLGLKVFVTDESKDSSTAKIHIAKYKDGSQARVQEDSIIQEIKIIGDRIYVEAKDKYGDKAYVEYEGKNGQREQVKLTLNNEGKYEGNIGFLSTDKGANWKIRYVIFEDAEGNAKAVYNKDIYKIFGANLKIIKK